MLNKIYLCFKEYLSETFPDVSIDDYRGEFNDKSPTGWNPRFPCCLITLDEYSPVVRSSANQIIKHSAKFTLFIGEKNSNGFEIIQQIIDDLNGIMLNIPIPETYYCVQVGSVKFVTGIKSVRVHSIEILIQ